MGQEREYTALSAAESARNKFTVISGAGAETTATGARRDNLPRSEYQEDSASAFGLGLGRCLALRLKL